MRKETKGLIALATMAAAGAGTRLAYDKMADEALDSLFVSDRFLDFDNSYNAESVTVRSLDGLTLSGKLVVNDPKKVIVLVHDRDDSYRSLKRYADEFTKMNYSVLLIDQRGVGESEGEYQMCGIREQFDILCWLSFLNKKMADPQIALLGEGTGALSCLLSLKGKVDANIKTVVAINAPLSIAAYISQNFAIKGSKLLFELSLKKKVEQKYGYDLRSGVIDDLKMSSNVNACFVAGEDHQSDAKELFSRYDGKKKYYPLSPGCKSALEDRSFFRHIGNYLKDYFD